jgi:hypothetical protein
MKQENIIEENKMIAEFMGAKYYPKASLFSFKKWSDAWVFQRMLYIGFSDNQLKFHSSWDWLMPVVEKIEKEGYGFTVTPWEIEIIDYKTGKEEIRASFINDEQSPKIDQYYSVVVDFIKFYKYTNP